MKKRYLFIIITIIIVFIMAFIFYSDLKQKGESDSDVVRNIERGEPYESLNEKDCKGVEFTEYFVDPTHIQKVGQIGVVHGSGQHTVGRSYVSFKKDLSLDKIPVYAPTDMVLVTGAYYQDPRSANEKGYLPDYALNFNAGCNVEITYAHLKEVVEEIRIQFPEIKLDSRTNSVDHVKFKAGDLVGYFIQDAGVAGFDFMVHDENVVNKFANQERQEFGYGTNLLHAVCPYDFYTEEKKEEYYNLIGGAGGTLFEIQECGPISRDFPGTISGQWFLEKEVTKWLYDFFKEGDYPNLLVVIGDEERITIGDLGSQGTNLVFSNNPTYKAPKDIIGEHCYEFFQDNNPDNQQGWAYFKLVNEETMDVSYSPKGACPDNLPNDAKRYYR